MSRRLWGGEYPNTLFGTDIRPFGGHNYGYTFDKQNEIIKRAVQSETDIPSFLRKLTASSWAGFGIALAGVSVCGIVPALKIIVASFAFQEVVSFSFSKYLEYSLAEYIKSHGMPPDTTRSLSGISVVLNIMAGWLFYYRNTGWTQFLAGWTLVMFNLQTMIQLPTIYRTHLAHWGSFALGYFTFSHIQPNRVFKPGFLVSVLLIITSVFLTTGSVYKFAPLVNIDRV